jgi:hypothetical protein
MTTASFALQKAIFETLTGDGALMALVEGVHDHVPLGAGLPYVTVGEDAIEPFAAKTFVGARHVLTLHVWSRARGRAETKAIIERLRALLDRAALALEGATLIDLRFTGAATLLEDDGLTYHGRARFVAATQETA